VERALILSALHTERFDLALDAARESTKRDGDPFFLVLAHAVRGEPEAAIEALEQCLGLGYPPSIFYEDPFLVEILQEEAYADFRRRHPADDDGEDDG